DIEGLKAEKEAIENRKKSKEKTIERLSKYLALALDGKPFETEKIALNFRRSKQVQIVDETKIPEEFMKIQIIEKKEPNKILIKKLIKDGLTIEGANLLEVQNLQIK
ncbi:MAG: siphovirus Gp157 family protein, partial [Clostridia bacterium]|nr:siphovirus Gp157 family protein [Clostridia bacterium]